MLATKAVVPVLRALGLKRSRSALASREPAENRTPIPVIRDVDFSSKCRQAHLRLRARMPSSAGGAYRRWLGTPQNNSDEEPDSNSQHPKLRYVTTLMDLNHNCHGGIILN